MCIRDRVYAWGMNNYGQLGVSAYKYGSASLPVLVKALSNVFAVKVAAGACLLYTSKR